MYLSLPRYNTHFSPLNYTHLFLVPHILSHVPIFNSFSPASVFLLFHLWTYQSRTVNFLWFNNIQLFTYMSFCFHFLSFRPFLLFSIPLFFTFRPLSLLFSFSLSFLSFLFFSFLSSPSFIFLFFSSSSVLSLFLLPSLFNQLYFLMVPFV